MVRIVSEIKKLVEKSLKKQVGNIRIEVIDEKKTRKKENIDSLSLQLSLNYH